jgi:hypothetical protein
MWRMQLLTGRSRQSPTAGSRGRADVDGVTRRAQRTSQAPRGNRAATRRCPGRTAARHGGPRPGSRDLRRGRVCQGHRRDDDMEQTSPQFAVPIESTWDELFAEVGPLMLDEANQNSIEQRLDRWFFGFAYDEGVENLERWRASVSAGAEALLRPDWRDTGWSISVVARRHHGTGSLFVRANRRGGETGFRSVARRRRAGQASDRTEASAVVNRPSLWSDR